MMNKIRLLASMVLLSSLCSAVVLLGDAHCWDAVDASIFIVMFILALYGYGAAGSGSTVYAPALFSTLGRLARAWVAGRPVPGPLEDLAVFLKYCMMSVVILVTLAITARLNPWRRFYDVLVVCMAVWGLSGMVELWTSLTAAGAPAAYLGGQVMLGAMAGAYCFLSAAGLASMNGSSPVATGGGEPRISSTGGGRTS